MNAIAFRRHVIITPFNILPTWLERGPRILPKLAIEFGRLDSNRSQMSSDRSYELRCGRVHQVERGNLIRFGSKRFVGVASHAHGWAYVGQQEWRGHVLGSGSLTPIGWRLFVRLLGLRRRLLRRQKCATYRLNLLRVLVLILGDWLVELLQDVRIVLRYMDQLVLAGCVKTRYTDQLLLRYVIRQGSPRNLGMSKRNEDA